MSGRAARWLLRPATRVTVAVLFLLLCALIGWGYYLGVSNRHLGHALRSDEHAACLIQQRGLRANKFLAVFVGDVHEILTIPQTQAQQQALAALPPKLRAQELKLRASLNMSTGHYSELESKQPATRAC